MEHLVKVENNTVHPISFPEILPDWPIGPRLQPGQITDIPKQYFDAAEAQSVTDAYGRTFQPAKRAIEQLQETVRIYTNGGMRIGPQITIYRDAAAVPVRDVQMNNLPRGTSGDGLSKKKAVEASLIIVRDTTEKKQLEYWLATEDRSEVKAAINAQLKDAK